MARRVSAKTLLYATLPILALLVVGVAASLWQDKLEAKLTVNLGTFDVSFDPKSNQTNVNKDYAELKVKFDEPQAGEGKDVMVITLNNAAPGTEATVKVDVVNYGSIPATVTPKVQSIDTQCLKVTITDDKGNSLSKFDLDEGDRKTIKITISIPEDCPESNEGKTVASGTVILTLDAVQK